MTTTKTTRRILEESITRGRQSATHRRLLRVGSFTLRMTVKSDSYIFQSEAHAEVWSNAALTWNSVYGIPYAAMATPTGLMHQVQDAAIGKATAADMARLERMALEILGA